MVPSRCRLIMRFPFFQAVELFPASGSLALAASVDGSVGWLADRQTVHTYARSRLPSGSKGGCFSSTASCGLPSIATVTASPALAEPALT